MQKNLETIYVICGVVVIFAIIGGAAFAFKKLSKQEDPSTALNDANSLNKTDVNATPEAETVSPIPTQDPNNPDPNIGVFKELVKEDTQVGSGTEAVKGKTITVNYTGKLVDGTVFDSSVGKQPFTFVLGGGQVIKGWDQGFDGMKVGGKRTLKIPSSLGYGALGEGGVIKPNYDLVFDVELLNVQ